MKHTLPTIIALLLAPLVSHADLPALPETMGSVSIPAQDWSLKPGPREIMVYIRYPGAGATIKGVQPDTGLMLSLHNWGGTASGGSADPGVLANKYNVVAIGVDYLQSGPQASINDPEPYDFGWLQSLDALRALHFVFDGLKQRGIAFDSTRIFTTGGSGGGNVSLMANKLAPRTFAAVIDMCGMKKLSDDIAFNLPGGSPLNARYTRDPKHPFHLSPDAQELHFVGNPAHLMTMKQLNCTAKIITVHGAEDMTCPFTDAEEYAANMKASGLDFTFVPVTKEKLDGKIFSSTGHPLGNRTLIVEHVAAKYLDARSPDALHRSGLTDFERKEDVRYTTTNGTWIIRYAKGYPEGRFEATTAASSTTQLSPASTTPQKPPDGARVFFTGHSFHGFVPSALLTLSTQAGVKGFENLGLQSLGGSRVIQHWNLPDPKNTARAALMKGGVDVLTLSPNMQIPDEGIEPYVEFALKHNPNIRVLVQGSWMTWDGAGKPGFKNAERDTRPVSEIRERTIRHMNDIRAQLTSINAKHGREVCTLVPAGAGVVRLRELIDGGLLPGITKPSQLFMDDIGHATPAIKNMVSYMFFAAIYQRDPQTVQGLEWPTNAPSPSPDLEPMLKRVAWETLLAEPLGGLKKVE